MSLVCSRSLLRFLFSLLICGSPCLWPVSLGYWSLCVHNIALCSLLLTFQQCSESQLAGGRHVLRHESCSAWGFTLPLNPQSTFPLSFLYSVHPTKYRNLRWLSGNVHLRGTVHEMFDKERKRKNVVSMWIIVQLLYTIIHKFGNT